MFLAAQTDSGEGTQAKWGKIVQKEKEEEGRSLLWVAITISFSLLNPVDIIFMVVVSGLEAGLL